MEITVDRTMNSEGDLIFTIKAKNPKDVNFDDVEKGYLQELDKAFENIDALNMRDSHFKDEAFRQLHWLKECAFMYVINQIKFSLNNSLDEKFQPMCQEIYNWVYDAQNGYLKKWLMEFDPQRTRYYFDNDKTTESDFSDA